MKKYLLNIALFTAFLSFVACDSDDKDETEIPSQGKVESAFIINEGNYSSGNVSSLSYYSKESGEVTAKVFETQNSVPLGNGAQDLLVYGAKMYISITGSNNIYITDHNAKLLKYSDNTPSKISIDKETTGLNEPRALIAHKGYVYASFYSGHIAKIDTTTMKIVDITPNTDDYDHFEEMTIVGNKLYVIESWDPNNRIAVLNLDEFKLETALTVTTNPVKITSDASGNIFTLSSTYQEVSENLWLPTTTFTQIKPNGQKITKTVDASDMEILDNNVLFVYRDYADDTATFSKYNISQEKVITESYITIDNDEHEKQLGLIRSINIHPVSKDIYLTTTDSQTEGNSQIFVFNEDGVYKTHFGTKGIAPNGAYFIVK